jgi:hypothetical protein
VNGNDDFWMFLYSLDSVCFDTPDCILVGYYGMKEKLGKKWDLKEMREIGKGKMELRVDWKTLVLCKLFFGI